MNVTEGWAVQTSRGARFSFGISREGSEDTLVKRETGEPKETLQHRRALDTSPRRTQT